ncbi:MAG: hypothetical protein ACUVTR_07315 [Dehalococcoidia bacterium]
MAIVLKMIEGGESEAAISKVRQGHGEVYGYQKVTKAVRAMDITVNGKKVLRHLRWRELPAYKGGRLNVDTATRG